MPFRINHTRTDVTDPLELTPGPTEVEYPDFRLYNARQTQDSSLIIQRPLNDPRPRKWIWKNYRQSVPNYESQFDDLKLLEARQLDADGYSPIIQVWENESDEGGIGGGTEGSPTWVDAKILQVHRRTRKGGGIVVYDETWIEFIIVDSTWEEF